MTKHDLSRKTGVSISFLSDLTNGKANPSLRVMQAIAEALETPLSYLLESTDLDRKTLAILAGGQALQNLPEGYERVTAVLPAHQAFIVRKWHDAAQKKLRSRK